MFLQSALEGTISIGGRTFTSLRFADDIDGLAGTEDEMASLVDLLAKTSSAYGLEINAENKNPKIMTYNTQGISKDITVTSQKLETVYSFKYLGAIVSDQGSKPEVISKTAQTVAALSKLDTRWKDKYIALSSKI